MHTINEVRKFMSAAGQTILDVPGQPSVEDLKLRLSLELEELYEKAQAFGLERTFQDMLHAKSDSNIYKDNGRTLAIVDHTIDTGIYDTAAVLDACVDQRYVADGTILACGLQEVFTAAFDNVQESNMSKFCDDAHAVKETVAKYQQEGVKVKISSPFFPKLFPAAVLRAEDNKVLKSVDYKPANMQQVLDNFQQHK